MRRVAADQRDDDPGSEKRRLGAPALLREISPARAWQEKAQQGRQQRSDPGHGRGDELGGDAADREGRRRCRCAGSRGCVVFYADSEYMA